MSLSKHFKTDESLEKAGIEIDYDSVKVRIARAGGANRRYAKRLEALMKPYRRAIDNGTIPDEVSQKIVRTVFAETVVLDWETKIKDAEPGKDPVYKKGISPEDAGLEPSDTLLPVNVDNVCKVFSNLPDFFGDLRDQATSSSLFRKDISEFDQGN